MDAKKLDEWFSSEEGRQSLNKYVEKLRLEEDEAQDLENKSKLVYPDGRKVKRGDLFIDNKAKERFQNDPVNEPYGYYKYVHRINEDETVDLCIDANFALKLNDSFFDFNYAELAERNAKLYSPLEEILS
ncbi:hypothetical protein AB1L07_02105 [Niallia alba]|uniref:hypothetical protein n=1 Tax=Niallia alba TaxID=2729105 RepID=UPI002E1BF7F6|nr:hypothetical protein [Niallia alba]